MARKSAALLKSTPVKLGKRSKDMLKWLNAFVPEPGCEDQWERHVKASTKFAETESRYDAICEQVEKEGGSSASPSWPAFEMMGREYMRDMSACFGALDAYTYAVKHLHDKKAIPESEIRAVVIDSLSDKLSALTFSVNTGILGSKLAQAIRLDVTEESSGDPPYCADCA